MNDAYDEHPSTGSKGQSTIGRWVPQIGDRVRWHVPGPRGGSTYRGIVVGNEPDARGQISVLTKSPSGKRYVNVHWCDVRLEPIHTELPTDTRYVVVQANGNTFQLTSAEAATDHQNRWPGSRVAVMTCTHWLDEEQ